MSIENRPATAGKTGLWGVLLLLGLTGLAGCFRSSPPDQFYMLRAEDAHGGNRQVGAGPLLGLGPIRIPAYLDRPQIVTAASGQEYHLSEDHRWAERLDDNVARVTARNLTNDLPGVRIVMHPWPREPKPDVQISLTLQEMHVDARGQARMSALWSLRVEGQETRHFQFNCNLPASVSDYAVMVEAQSQCLARLNRDMAREVADVPGKN